MLLFALVFYLIFARFREQACTFICPYGRFQSVLLDEHSIVVAYDHKRGEKRGKLHRSETADQRRATGLGDCVDCHQCVAVCPTGIDIRNGTQMECVHCTACIDACDATMDKIGRPRGLIRYASLNGIEKGDPRGEFIQLQLTRTKGELGKEQAHRESALLRKHQALWLGELGAVLDNQNYPRLGPARPHAHCDVWP